MDTSTVHLTRLCKHLDGCHDVKTVTLPWDNEVQLLEDLGFYGEGVAPGR